MVICELMLLDLGDLLWSSWLKNFFSAQGQYFLVNILLVLFSISGGSETNSKFGYVVGWVGGMEELRIKLSQHSSKL